MTLCPGRSFLFTRTWLNLRGGPRGGRGHFPMEILRFCVFKGQKVHYPIELYNVPSGTTEIPSREKWIQRWTCFSNLDMIFFKNLSEKKQLPALQTTTENLIQPLSNFRIIFRSIEVSATMRFISKTCLENWRHFNFVSGIETKTDYAKWRIAATSVEMGRRNVWLQRQFLGHNIKSGMTEQFYEKSMVTTQPT